MISSVYVFAKSIQYIAIINQKIATVVWCLLWSFLYACVAIEIFSIPLSLFRPIMCLTTTCFVFLLTRKKLETVVSAYLLSFGFSLVLYYIAMIPGSVITALFARGEHIEGTPLDFNQPIFLVSYTMVAILQIVLSFFLFRIKRFRKGFPFIFKRYTIVAALFFTGIILILVTWVNMITQSEESVYIGLLYIRTRVQ